jgi:hypothetical protein
MQAILPYAGLPPEDALSWARRDPLPRIGPFANTCSRPVLGSRFKIFPARNRGAKRGANSARI